MRDFPARFDDLPETKLDATDHFMDRFHHHLKEGEIGFATLPDQVHRKSVKKGFDFTMMVCGESGLGKSTMINSLFLSELYHGRRQQYVQEKINQTVQIETKGIEIEEKGVKLRLTVVDTPGFGDALNCETHWKTIDDFLCSKFMEYYSAESGLNRKCIQDNRVHCCLYFIPPYGHGLREMDINLMKHLQDRVNVIPIISKADTLTRNEVNKLKARIRSDIQTHDIKVYQLPELDSDEDETVRTEDAEIKAAWPFAVVASTQILEVRGQKIHGRLYPWGVVDVEDPEHSDFLKIRKMLIATHMQDLKEVTHDILYEQFRAQLLSSFSNGSGFGNKPKLPVLIPNALKLQSPSLDSGRVTPDVALCQKDEEIRKMQEMLAKMQEQLRMAGKDPSLTAASSPSGSRFSRSSVDCDSVINV